MSGALNSVLGGANPIGALLNVASVAFPPLGIATSVANMITQGVGQAVNQAAQQLSQAAGMPKFLTDMVGGLVKDVIGKLTQHSNPGCDEASHEHFGGDIGKMIEDLVKSITDGAKAIMEQGQGGDDCKGGKAGKGGKGGAQPAGNWLIAMARAMGAAAGDHAKRMVELSNKINDLSSKGKGIDASSDAGKKEQADNAAETSAAQAEFQAEGQMFSMLQNSFSNAIKSIGEGLTTMARKG
ncbi:MAG TPA: hypothetical protein VKI18_04710 [Albitalea sp.]|nr:hypothetical protein [Albitalea sp.]